MIEEEEGGGEELELGVNVDNRVDCVDGEDTKEDAIVDADADDDSKGNVGQCPSETFKIRL